MRSLIFAAILVAVGTGSVGAQTTAGTAFDLNSKLINSPLADWTIYGPGQTSKRIETGGPKGYPAYQVNVLQAGKNAWDVGAVSVVPKPVHAGDVILVAVYLRAPQLAANATEELPLVSNQWQVFFASGTAPQDFPANGVQATVHLANNKHVIELGPIKVYDFGAGFDLRRLPHN
jgi:hypothetical protein